MYRPILYPGHDLADALTLIDVHPATGAESPVTTGTVTAILATSPDATTPADPTLSVAATHLGGGEWLAHFDNTILTAPLLATHFADAVPYLVFIADGGQTANRKLEYRATREGITPLDDLRAVLRVRNTAEDDFILHLFDRAVATIEEQSGEWYGAPKTVTETVDGYGSTIWLRSTPNSITSVETYEGGLWNPITAYESIGRRITLTEDVVAWTARRRVVYATGRAYQDIPAHVLGKIFQLATLWFEQRLPTADAVGVEQAVIGAVGGI